VQVWTNGIQAACGGSNVSLTDALGAACYFQYRDDLTPVVTSVSPTAVAPGVVLTIVGSGFGAAVGDNVVTLGGVTPCAVTDASATQLVCTVGTGAAGEYPIVVSVTPGGRGIAALASDVPLLTYALAVSAASASVAGVCGGATVVLSGNGFDLDGNSVVLRREGEQLAADVVASTHTALTFVTPALSARCALSASVYGVAPPAASTMTDPPPQYELIVNDVATGLTLQYSDEATPRIASLSPSVASAARSHTITLAVDNVPAAASAQPLRVSFGDRSCAVATQSWLASAADPLIGTTSVTCRLVRGELLNEFTVAVPPVVVVLGVGVAHPQASALTVGVLVSGLSARSGSRLGGNQLTITGYGFGNDASLVTVTIVDRASELSVLVDCVPTIVSPTSVTCTVSMNAKLNHDALGAVRVTVLSFFSDSPVGQTAACWGDVCDYDLLASRTPVVLSASAIAPDDANPGGTLVVTGSGFEAPLEVSVGPYGCPILSHSSATEVVCRLPVASADVLEVMVVVASSGMAAVASTATHTFPLVVDSQSAAAGSAAGGHVVTLRGRGLHSDPAFISVTFGGQPAVVLSGSPTEVVVRTPAYALAGSTAAAVDVLVTVKRGPTVMLQPSWAADVVTSSVSARVLARMAPQHERERVARSKQRRLQVASSESATATLTAAYEYSAALVRTPIVSSVVPVTGWAATPVLILGSGFEAVRATGSAVSIGGADCAVTTWNDSAIACTVGAAAAGRNAVLVTVASKGLAQPTPGGVFFTARLEVRVGVAFVRGVVCVCEVICGSFVCSGDGTVAGLWKLRRRHTPAPHGQGFQRRAVPQRGLRVRRRMRGVQRRLRLADVLHGCSDVAVCVDGGGQAGVPHQQLGAGVVRVQRHAHANRCV
jgi:hypothetical protein